MAKLSAVASEIPDRPNDFKIRWVDNVPYWGVHAMALAGIIYSGWSWAGLGIAIALYFGRMFFVTAGYHRYFAHRTYKTSRFFQFILALGGATCTQKGALWWAAHHRRHHKYSDMPEDVHSVVQRGFYWGHQGWILVNRHRATEWDRIKDLSVYPELRFLNRFPFLVDVGFPVALYFIGGWHLLLWGYFVSTVMLWHGTFTINSLAHLWGRKRYKTGDESRNNGILALLTMGEGWHNNHHYYQRSTSQGFYWWEIDVTYYLLRTLQLFRIVWDIHEVPEHVREDVRKRVDREPPADADGERQDRKAA
jgi:stearoyl-CoA desaturase (delta-9 desaturase)